MFKRIASLSLTAIMLLGSAVSVQAADVSRSGGNGSSKVTLDVSSRTFRVTVPSVLPIWVDSDNNVTVADNAKIRNLSEGPVDVTNVSVEADNGWSLVPFNTDFKKVPVDTKQYGMTMYGDDVVDGVDLSLFDRIDGSDEISVVYDGNVAIQQRDINKADIGHVVFTVAWAEAEGPVVQNYTYNVQSDLLTEYMSNPDYSLTDYSTTYMTERYLSNRSIVTRPAGVDIEAVDGVTQITVTSNADGKSFTADVNGSSYTVNSLIPGVQYSYYMKDSSGNVLKTGTIIGSGKVRTIYGGNIDNVRDLGGWNADGGKLKYGLLYRGADPRTASADTIKFFKDFLGIKAELNLRGTEDTLTYSAFGEDVDYVNYALGAYAMRIDKYTSSIDHNLAIDCLNYVLNCLENNKPVYFHCAAGADRTATIAFLVEALCGVSESDMWRDFEITALAGRTRNSTEYGSAFRTQLTGVIPESCDKANIKSYVAQWCIAQGFGVDKINRLRHLLIDGNPGDFALSDETVVDVSSAIKDARLNSTGTLITKYKAAQYGTFYVTDILPADDTVLVNVKTDVAINGDNVYLRYFGCYDENGVFLGRSVFPYYVNTNSYSTSVGLQWFEDGNSIGGIDATKVDKLRIGFACNDLNNVEITTRKLILP